MPQTGGKPKVSKAPKKTSSSTKRHFTVVMGNKEHGLYVSSSPSSAARKAVSKLCASNKSKKVEFRIREITQGSKKKTYGPYKGYIEKLKEPIELKGRVIKYKPVAKLSGKTGAKKGGRRGGGEIIVKKFQLLRNTKVITVTFELNGKDYNCTFLFNKGAIRYSKYMFYNKTTKRYMNDLYEYIRSEDDIGGISEALRRGDKIVIRMYESGSVKELLGTQVAELSNEELMRNVNSIVPKEHKLIENSYLQVSDN